MSSAQEFDASGREGPDQGGDGLQGGALAGPVGPEHGDDLALAHGEVDSAQGRESCRNGSPGFPALRTVSFIRFVLLPCPGRPR